MEELANLPPTALVALGLGLAVIFGVRYLGIMQGERSSPASQAGSAQVAAVIVDPTALNNARNAIEDLTGEIRDLNHGVGQLVLELARRR